MNWLARRNNSNNLRDIIYIDHDCLTINTAASLYRGSWEPWKQTTEKSGVNFTSIRKLSQYKPPPEMQCNYVFVYLVCILFLESRIEEAELKIRESKEELKMAKQIRKHRQG